MKIKLKNGITQLAKTLFEYLYLKEEPESADAVMGFGHFDAKIPLRCGELFSKGFAPLLIFTGGSGSGSGKLKKPEAQEFYDILKTYYSDIPADKIILEDRSTNTSENLQFTLSILQKNYPHLAPPNGIKKAIIVANAYRQRRVWLTCRKQFKVEFINCPPSTGFENELKMYQSQGEDFVAQLINEIEKLQSYSARGFIAAEKIPGPILETCKSLKTLHTSILK